MWQEDFVFFELRYVTLPMKSRQQSEIESLVWMLFVLSEATANEFTCVRCGGFQRNLYE